VARVGCHVDRGGLPLEAREQLGEIDAAAVLPDDDRGHALADHRNGLARGLEPPIVMAVGVDEPRRQRQSAAVNDVLTRRRREPSDCDNPITLNPDVGRARGGAAAVDDASVPNERRGPGAGPCPLLSAKQRHR
jgi:hypothetical protein